MKKYILISGIINSKNDGDEHYISADKLRELYKLNKEECIFFNKEQDVIGNENFPEGCVILRPRYDGNYNLELEGVRD